MPPSTRGAPWRHWTSVCGPKPAWIEQRVAYDHPMSLTRRQFLWSAAASSVLWPSALRAQDAPADAGVFRHGVASGDPLTDRVMLWTRVTTRSTVVDVRWRIATDAALAQVVGTGIVSTDA